MLRKEIYQCIATRLREELGDAIQHIDLWNHNVEFIDQETPWQRPAVFVEFGVINWQRLGGAPSSRRGEGTVSIHLVTDWVGGALEQADFGSDEFAAFELSERIFSVLRGLRGEHFHGLELLSTNTNHNHEELLENIDVYRFVGTSNNQSSITISL